jgi:beta-carotene 15,15'-dioxygenase
VNRALRMQGALFSGIAFLVAAASVSLPRLAPRAEVLIVAALIVLLGVPHGALDTVFARERFALRRRRDWFAFSVAYALLMIGVVLVWLFAPVVFLVGFLGISAFHFSGDPVGGTPDVTRVVQGGAVLILPALRHADEFTRLFAMLVGPAAARAIAPILSEAAIPWAAALVVCAALTVRQSTQTAIELLAVGTLACVAPPLLAFAVFFCGMHSARHILRSAIWAQDTERRLVVTAVLAPMLGVACLSVSAWHVSGDIPLEAKAIQLIFVGLASVTVPHMLLIEPIRLAGWRDGNSGAQISDIASDPA